MPTLSTFWAAAARLTGRLDLSGLPTGVDPSTLSRPELVLHGVPPRHADALCKGARPVLAPRFLCWSDPGYPPGLQRIPHAPPVLFVEGDLTRLAAPGVAVVGARRCTGNGRRMARDISRAVSDAGGIVVSGLAQGIDSEAHSAARGRTIAVLGQGLGRRLPGSRERLRQSILEEGGLVLSELFPDRQASRITFPMRNRIIAGLAKVTVVVEARERSGSRITARNALEAGRDVMAVPGHPFHELAQGCLALLKEGAEVVLHPKDVVDAAGLVPPSETHSEDPLLSAIGNGADFEGLLRISGLDTRALLRQLTMLELNGLVDCLPGGRYSLRAR